METDVGLVTYQACQENRPPHRGDLVCGIDASGEPWFGKFGIDCAPVGEVAA